MAALTAQSYINLACKEIQVVDPGDTLNNSEYTDALARLNMLLDNLSLERLNIPVIVVLSRALSTTVAAYTVGPGGTFSTTRPLRIPTAMVKIPAPGGTGFVESEIRPLSQTEYAVLRQKGASAVEPEAYYYDWQFPTGTINFYPTPTFSSGTVTVDLYVWQALANFPDLNTTAVALPQGYDRWLVLMLAAELAPMFSVPPAVLQQTLANANEARAALRAMNASMMSGQTLSQPPPSSALNAIPQQIQQPPAGGQA